LNKSSSSLKELIFGLYLKPSLLVISFYQIIITSTFTAQQILLAAYLDELGYLEEYGILSGVILAIYFIFMFFLGPVCATLSDMHGRKYLMFLSNWICAIGFIGLIIIPNPVIMIIMNGLIGIGASLRIGSTLALWIQHSPKERIGESIGYSNLIMGIGGGIGVLFIGFFANQIAFSFMFFGLLLFISAFPIFFMSDVGDYTAFSLKSTFKSIMDLIKGKIRNNFFITKPIIQVCIHWAAFSTIISFGTFLIPILERIIEELPSEVNIPSLLLFFIITILIISIVGGLLIWGIVSDKWKIRPVLFIGFIGTCLLVFFIFILFQFNLIVPLINGLEIYDPISILLVFILILCVFTATSLIPTPMNWIVELVGEDDLAKAMSMRMALIAIGTIIGTAIGPAIITYFGISGFFLFILFLVLVSAIILL